MDVASTADGALGGHEGLCRDLSAEHATERLGL
jgi:hypothetical protein